MSGRICCGTTTEDIFLPSEIIHVGTDMAVGVQPFTLYLGAGRRFLAVYLQRVSRSGERAPATSVYIWVKEGASGGESGRSKE